MQGRPEIDDQDGKFSSSAKPLVAIAAGVQFLLDLEETSHFFRMTGAIDGQQNEKNYQRYIHSPVGSKLDRDNVNFANVLNDKDALEHLPTDSLARNYLDFMAAENLEMGMLTDAEQNANASAIQLNQSRRNYMDNGFATHDMLHVVTGYGRDPIGEACVLAFTAEQFKLSGVGVFSWALALRESITHPQHPVLKMTAEARRIARKAVWVAEIDWRDYLGKPLHTVRRECHFERPRLYLRARPPAETVKASSAITPSAQKAA